VRMNQGCSLGLETFFGTFRSHLALEDITSRLGFRDFGSCKHPCSASGSQIYQGENNGSDPQETGRQVTRLHQCSAAVYRGVDRIFFCGGCTQRCHVILRFDVLKGRGHSEEGLKPFSENFRVLSSGNGEPLWLFLCVQLLQLG